MIQFEFRRDLRHQKTRVPGLSCGVICMIRLAVLIQYWSVTERLTMGYTHDDGIYRVSVALRSKNEIKSQNIYSILKFAISVP